MMIAVSRVLVMNKSSGANNDSSSALRADVRKSAASPRRISFSDRFASYRLHHQQIAIDSLQRLFKSPLSTLATWLVIGIALALPGALYIGLANIERLSAGWDNSAQLSLYLKRDISDDTGNALATRLEKRGDVAKVRYITRDAALTEFRELSGFGDVLNQLEQNPLPATIVVLPARTALDPAAAKHLLDDLKALPEVEQAVLDLQWVQRLHAILAIGRQLAWVLAVLLGVGVVLVIGNTIRLAIEARRNEIVVVKLVGGTNAFVRRPFLYTGFWYGMGGGLLAWVIVAFCLYWLRDPIAQLADAYGSPFVLAGPDFLQVAILLGAGSLLGWLGAWGEVARHLGAIEPT
jgi:cell division transport system permease protein